MLAVGSSLGVTLMHSSLEKHSWMLSSTFAFCSPDNILAALVIEAKGPPGFGLEFWLH